MENTQFINKAFLLGESEFKKFNGEFTRALPTGVTAPRGYFGVLLDLFDCHSDEWVLGGCSVSRVDKYLCARQCCKIKNFPVSLTLQPSWLPQGPLHVHVSENFINISAYNLYYFTYKHKFFLCTALIYNQTYKFLF